MMARAPEDQEQRQQAIDPGHSVHVEAPAGSGKTTVLLKRYLALLAKVQEPEEILALTFTRKAAGELRTRIQAELNKREDPGGVNSLPAHETELRELALAAIRRHADKGAALLERLQVGTFHGFCAQLLKLAPHRAGLPPDFGLLEETATKRLQKEAVARLGQRLRILPAGDPVRQALVRRLVRLNNNWPRLAAELQDLLARRDILGEFITLARESRDPAAYQGKLLEHLKVLIGPRLSRLAQEFRQAEIGRRWPELYRCLADSGSSLMDTLPAAVPGDGLEDLVSWRNMANGILTTKGHCYRRLQQPKFPKKFKESSCCQLLQDLPEGLPACLNFFREMSSILLPEDEVSAVQDLIILLHETLKTYEALCASRRSLDFTALEQVALHMLRAEDLPELFQRLDRRLTHLLVDEFQDTSVNQMHLLCRLLAGWQGDRQRSLMVVGDPKQSIYGWRQARLELFFESRDTGLLADCPESPALTTLALKTNFRSSAALIEWANEVFGQTIMADRETSGVDFKAAAAKLGAEAGSAPQLSLFAGSEARRQEAEWLARELLRLERRQQQVPPQERETVGVLLFTRTHLPVYLEAWRRVGLSPRVRDGLPLEGSLAVQHLHNLATALVRPHDDLAWAGLLQGWGGPEPLGLLAEIAKWPGDFWSGKIRQYAAGAGCRPEVKALFQVMSTAIRRVGREPLEIILGDCLIGLDAWENLATWEGPQGVANARAYLEMLAGAAGATPEATLVQAEDLLAQAYQPPDPRAQDSPLEVLTVHAAKGLEFDHVFLPFLDWQPLKTGKKDAPFLMEEVPGTGTALIALNRSYLQKEQSVLYQTLYQTAQRNALAEARRLFYVAVTRAKKRLSMSGVVSENKSGDWNFPTNAPLGWLRQHYPEAELNAGAAHIWSTPRLVVTLHPEVTDREAVLPTCASAAIVWGTPHPAPLPWRGEGNKEVSRRSEDLPGEGHPGEEQRKRGEEGRTQDMDPDQEPHAGESPAQAGYTLPDPFDIPPEPRPYSLRLPSQLSKEDYVAKTPDEAAHSPLLPGGGDAGEKADEAFFSNQVNRVIGEISHRLLDTLARGEALPEAAAVAPALQTVVESPESALRLAGEILAEIRACQADPFLGPLLSPNLPVARSEWLVEAWHTGNDLYRGQIDRLVYDGRDWWLLDYKTSRPAAGISWEAFMTSELEKYLVQLLAYREMAARFYQVDPPELIKTALYFTACRRHILL